MAKILVVEDDANIRMALEDDLAFEGFKVECAIDGDTGLKMAIQNPYDLIILDLMLPKRDGFDICRELRSANISTPILMLTAKSYEIDKVLGLDLGADDYVTKPFSPRELLARIKAILRRTHQVKQESNVLRLGELENNFEKMEAIRGDRLVYLTALEYSLLYFFLLNMPIKSCIATRFWIRSGVRRFMSACAPWAPTSPICAKRSNTILVNPDLFKVSAVSDIDL